MKPQLIASTNHFLTTLDYGPGFSSSDIMNQANYGPYTAAQDLPNFHTNAALPLGAAQEMDKVILRAVTAQPRFFGDLTAAGCAYNVPFGTYLVRHSTQNLADAPVITNDFTYEGGNYSNAYQSQNDYGDVITPIPMLLHRFALSKKQIAAAENANSLFGGLNLETQEIYTKTLSMASAIDTLLWNGTDSVSIRVGTQNVPLYGVLNYPAVVANQSQVTLDMTKPADFINTIRGQIQILVNRKYDGKFVIYYSSNLESAFNADYTGQFPLRTIEERLLQMSRVQDVRNTHFLDPQDDPMSEVKGTMVIMKLDPQVIDVVKESEIRVAQYADNPELVRYLMFASLAPRVKQDYYGNVGIQLVNITVKGNDSLVKDLGYKKSIKLG